MTEGAFGKLPEIFRPKQETLDIGDKFSVRPGEVAVFGSDPKEFQGKIGEKEKIRYIKTDTKNIGKGELSRAAMLIRISGDNLMQITWLSDNNHGSVRFQQEPNKEWGQVALQKNVPKETPLSSDVVITTASHKIHLVDAGSSSGKEEINEKKFRFDLVK